MTTLAAEPAVARSGATPPTSVQWCVPGVTTVQASPPSSAGAAPPTPPVVAELQGLVDQLADVPLADVPGPVLLAELEGLLGQADRLGAQIARRARAVAARDEAVAETGQSTVTWLVDEARRAPREARRLLTRARTLDEQPEVAAALADGRIPAHAADDLCRALHQLPEEGREDARAILLPLAEVAGQPELRRAIDEYRLRVGVDESADAAAVARAAQRHLDLYATFGGTVALSGLLEPDTGHALGLALVAHSRPAGPDDERTPTQRRADALVHIIEQHLVHGAVPDTNGERPRIVITLTLADLLDAPGLRSATDDESHLAPDVPTDATGAAGPAGTTASAGAFSTPTGPTLPGGIPLATAVARRYACDAEFVRVLFGRDGEVLDAGRATRDWTAAQRRAVAARSGGTCETPGCDHTATVIHHVRWWSKDGPTSVENAAHLCRLHHWLVHHTAWDVYWQGHQLRLSHPDGATRAQLGAKAAFAGDGAPWRAPPPAPHEHKAGEDEVGHGVGHNEVSHNGVADDTG